MTSAPLQQSSQPIDAALFIADVVILTEEWTQCAGGCWEYLTASSTTPSLCSKPGLEHMEKPPTFSTPGMNKSTLHNTNTTARSQSVN